MSRHLDERGEWVDEGILLTKATCRACHKLPAMHQQECNGRLLFYCCRCWLELGFEPNLLHGLCKVAAKEKEAARKKK